MKYNDIYKNQYLNSSINLPTMLWWSWNSLMHLIHYNGCYWFNTAGRKMTYAIIRGGPLAPNISGVVYFVDVPNGTQVCTNITGLPPYQPASNNRNPIGPHGFHIHEHGTCEVGDPADPFKAAGSHWNPDNQPHGNHAGDFPVLFSNNGAAVTCFFTNRFKPWDVIGKTVIIHQNPDDYRSEPAGNSGKRLACGVIQ